MYTDMRSREYVLLWPLCSVVQYVVAALVVEEGGGGGYWRSGRFPQVGLAQGATATSITLLSTSSTICFKICFISCPFILSGKSNLGMVAFEGYLIGWCGMPWALM